MTTYKICSILQIMRTIILLLLITANLYSQEHSREYLKNSCLINSIGMYQDVHDFFKNRNIWNNVLVMSFTSKDCKGRCVEESHAVTIFNWNNQYYAYDINQGSWPIRTSANLQNSPLLAAKLICPRWNIKSARYLVSR